MGLIKRGRAWNRAQAGSRWSPRQVVVLISVMVLAFVLSPVGARAAQVGSASITEQVSVDSSTPSPRAGPGCTIVGTAGDDRLRGTRRDDVICALAGNDRVFGRGGNDTLILGGGEDRASGGPGDDVIRLGGDGDLGDGNSGNDRIYGQGGEDALVDYLGRDVVSGGAGDDPCLNVGDFEGGDVIRGGGGRDHFNADDGDKVFTAEVGPAVTCG